SQFDRRHLRAQSERWPDADVRREDDSGDALNLRVGRARYRLGAPNVGRDDAAVRARTLDVRQVDAGFAGEAACQRRDHRAAGKPRRTIVAVGRADLTERLHFEWSIAEASRLLWPFHPLIPAKAGIQIFLFAV